MLERSTSCICLHIAASLLQERLLLLQGQRRCRIQSGRDWSLSTQRIRYVPVVYPALTHTNWHYQLAHTPTYCYVAARESSSPHSRGAKPLGPHCPDWIRQASDQAEDASYMPQSPRSNHKSSRDTDLSMQSQGVSKNRHQKSHKKTRKKKRHKHKQRTPEQNIAQH